jgi:hypothetical protein
MNQGRNENSKDEWDLRNRSERSTIAQKVQRIILDVEACHGEAVVNSFPTWKITTKPTVRQGQRWKCIKVMEAKQCSGGPAIRNRQIIESTPALSRRRSVL